MPSCCRDHPRACGAHISLCLLSIYMCGIIPAHAGLTYTVFMLSVYSQDHPRACGAHTWSADDWRWRSGSSPRMRGSLNKARLGHALSGIIPAHAGLTRNSSCRRGHRWDHPRACGAHGSIADYFYYSMGSSPRIRGSLFGFYDFKFHDGIIPAHAGLTQPFSKTHRPNRDHPRACGAHISATYLPHPSPGSSPRMRGSH